MFEKYSKKNPVNRVRLTMRFAWSKPSHIAATFFGAGALRPAPGTWGTAAGVVAYALLSPVVAPWGFAGWAVLSLVLFLIGVWAAADVARDLGVEDHGGVVIDEVVAVWLVCAGGPDDWRWWLAAFAAFRVFDIVKIWPGSWADKHIKGGFGVMVDDLFAAFYAWAFLEALRWVGATYF